ncbi:MAG: serine protease [Parcubacteria group bacterium]|jgi:V8-like Glu-specific endopeptidase
MDIPKIIQEIRSGVILVSFYKDTEKIGSGSAFLCKNKIISNNHVFHPREGNFPSDTMVILKATDSEFKFQYSDLAKYVVCGSTENYDDYIILDIKNTEVFKNKFCFELGTNDDVVTGQQILIMGYPFEHENLTSHVGYISAKYTESNVNVIQLDVSVNNGNSGGPLIDPFTNNVIGVVSRKATGLVRQFDDLIASFDYNAKILGQLSGLSWGKDLTIGKIFSISQNQMKEIASNIKRSANVGIGYAFSCDKLISEFEKL